MMTERTYRTRRQTISARDLRANVSKTESRLWPHLRKSQLGAPFRRQHPVGPYFPDYYCVPIKLAVEVDGPLHNADKDSIRDHWMQSRGITVLRFSVQEIDENRLGVLSTIRDQIWYLQNSS